MAHPTNVAFVHTTLDTPEQVMVSGNYVYLTAFIPAGQSCWVFDISTRTNPVAVKRIVPTSGFHGQTVSGNYAYFAGFRLAVYDVSDPTNANLVASLQLADGGNHVGLAVAVSRAYAYIGETDRNSI